MTEEIYLKFLQRLQDGGITELTNLTLNLGGLDKYNELSQQYKNLYFVSYLPNEERYKANEVKPERSRDEYVKGISYFKLDVDIRKYIYLHEQRIISEEELLAYKDKVLDGLKQDELLSTYTAVIHSGNGIHIYWVGPMTEIDAKTYSAASKELYNRIKNLFPDNPELHPDYATGNISSLMRLPGSMNCKDDYKLPPHKVEILEYNEEDSPLVSMLNDIGNKYLEEESIRVEQHKQDMINKCKSRFSNSMPTMGDTYYRINNLIPIAELVCNYTGWTLANNGTNFISNRDGRYTGAYIIPEENILVHMGTPHIQDEFKVYSPFSFIMVHYGHGSPKETFERAKENYPWVEEKKAKKGEKKEEPEEDIADKETMFDDYINSHFPGTDKSSETFQTYRRKAMEVLKKANFLIFPKEMIITLDDNKGIAERIYKCDLVVKDVEYKNCTDTCSIYFDQDWLLKFDSLQKHLLLQHRKVNIDAIGKTEETKFCKNLNSCFVGFDEIFGIPVVKNVPYIGFDLEDKNMFTFTNGELNLSNKQFTPGANKLALETSVEVSYYRGENENLTLKESLTDILSLKNYISENITESATIIGFMISGIFRNDYKTIINEFPFLGLESSSGSGKTVMLTFLSRICGYDAGTIKGTCDSKFAFETGLNSLGGWFYFVDEIQKVGKDFLDSLQAAYNGGESRRGGNGDRFRLRRYRKDCCIVCAGEILPQDEQALLNRFIILKAKNPFLLVKNVKNKGEFEKYKELTGEEVNGEYLNQRQIEIIAKQYFRPRFQNILKNKNEINFAEYHKKALTLIESIVKDFGEQTPDARLVNNFSVVLAGYMIACGDEVDENELMGIIAEYFTNFLDYKRETYVSGKMVNYIIENIGEFCNRGDKVKGSSPNYPMIYLKYSDKESGLYMRIASISRYLKAKLESPINPKHLEQQFCEKINCKGFGSRQVKAAKGNLTMTGVFIPYETIKKNEFLRNIWDCALDYLCSHSQELEKFIDDSQQYRISRGILQALIDEMDYTYEKAEYFDTSNYSKDNPEIKTSF